MPSSHPFRACYLPLVASLLFAGCDSPPERSASGDAPRDPNVLEIVFTYGSEKEDWLVEVTSEFNRSRVTTADGKVIAVRTVPMGSGECIATAIDGSVQAHVTSPASGAFITLGNAESRAKTGSDLVASTENLVLSPVVIAMWKPMAEALGWPEAPVGWGDILALSQHPDGWASVGLPQWGNFKFGHTHPEFSNSGLIALIAEVYSGAGKVNGLTLEDVARPEVGDYLENIERSVVHYGRSTGFFGKKLLDNGPQYLSAAVLYENMVIGAYAAGAAPPVTLVAIYPKEGTFWSDHPVGIVEREWVTDSHRAAVRTYLDYLLDPAQQERALRFGFRPADVTVALGPPVDRAHGVDPQEPKTTLEVPSAEVMDAVLKLWHEHKKASNITLVLDTSGSMADSGRMANAKTGARELVSLLEPRDTFSLLPFNTRFDWAARRVLLDGESERARINVSIDGLIPLDGTALYDAVAAAFDHMQEEANGDRISAIVVLTDGEDTESEIDLPELLARISSDSESRNIRVFTIGYDAQSMKPVLEQIAESTKAKYYEGKSENIQAIFREIATFF